MTERQFKIILNKFFKGTTLEKENTIIDTFEAHYLLKHEKDVFKNDAHKQELQQTIYKAVQDKTQQSRFLWTKIAAAVLLLLGSGLLAYLFTTNNTDMVVVQNTSSTTKEVVLVDGSIVTLNQNGKLSYHKKTFNTNFRNVSLEGEAFFKVAKNPKAPFIIQTGELQTKVVGTQFNIKKHKHQVKVTVTEGKVAVYHQQDTVHLRLNEQAVYNIKSYELATKKVNSSLYTLWQNNKVMLNSITMADLAIILQELYDVNIQFKDEASKTALMSVGFSKNEALSQILTRINLLNEVKITQKPTKNMIIIEKAN